MKPFLLLLLLAGLLLAGCFTVPVDVTLQDGSSEIPAGFTVPIRPTLNLATREDHVKNTGSTLVVQSGKVIREVFTGGAKATATADVLSSRLSLVNVDLGLTTQATYTATLVIEIAGQPHTITATATGTSHWSVIPAIKEAIERTVVDLAKQAQALLPPPAPGLEAVK